MKVIADFSVVPIGVGVSVSKYVAACQRVLDEMNLKTRLHAYLSEQPCRSCSGARLQPAALAVTVGRKNIHEFTQMNIAEALATVESLKLDRERTQIARTIQMKTDFVANASHELRTPLSAIRSAVQTVLSIDIERDAVAAKRFLEVIDRQAEYPDGWDALVGTVHTADFRRRDTIGSSHFESALDVGRGCRPSDDLFVEFAR